MRNRMRLVFAVAFLILLIGSLVAACGQAKEAPATLDGKALTEDRCTKCHDLKRVEEAKKTKEGWKANVERMVGKGAELNQAEQEAVIEYLTATYPE